MANRARGTLHKLLTDDLVAGYPVPDRILKMEALPRSISDRTAIPVPQALAILAKASRTRPGG